MKLNDRIYIAGHTGLVGSSMLRTLKEKGYTDLITIPRSRNCWENIDLRSQRAVDYLFAFYKPDYVFNCAAHVGGILENNTYPADFIYDNIMISTNIIHASYEYKVKKLLNLGSSCLFPRDAKQPIKEEYILTGELEKTNEAYAIAKISAIKMCSAFNKQYGTNFISVMPCNLYGIEDSFDLNSSHVLPALIRKFHEARINNEKSVTLWGDGSALREFLYVDDLAEACIMLMEKYSSDEIGEFINIGSGYDVSINELAYFIKDITDFEGDILYDTSKPNGTPRKLMDSSKIKKLGWSPKMSLLYGIDEVYKWFVENNKKGNIKL